MLKKILYSLFFNAIFIVHVTAVEIPFVQSQQILEANLNQPSAVAIAENQDVFVLDGLKERIVVFNKNAQQQHDFSLSLKNNDNLSAPMDLMITESKIIIADTGNHRLVEYSREGLFHRFIDLQQVINTDQKPPEPVALWLEEDFFYWSDRANHQICKMRLKDYQTIRCFGSYGESNDQFRFPFQISTDRDGYLHTVDVLNARVLVYNSRGKLFSQTARFGLNPGELFRPNGIAVDDNDFVFISDSYLGSISIFRSGEFIAYLKDHNNTPLSFDTPVYLRLVNNKLYVVDALQNKVISLRLAYKQLQDEPSELQLSASKKLSSGKNCITCHITWEKKTLKPSLYDDKRVLPVASEKMCYSCHHGAVVESRIAIREKHQHPTIHGKEQKLKKSDKETKEQDPVPDSFPLLENDQLLCTSCHTPHNSDDDQEVLYQGHKNSWMRVTNKGGDLCEQCHESKIVGARSDKMKGVNHPLAIKFLAAPDKNDKNYVQEAHLEHGLPEELSNNGAILDKQQQLICQSCHEIHAGKEKDLLTLSDKDSELCISCHKKQSAKGKKKAHQKGIHPVNVELEEPIEYQGKIIKEVTCSSCHKVHDGNVSTALLWEATEDDIEKLCTVCHQRHTADSKEEAAKKGIHPVNIDLKEPVKINNKTIKRITCLSCHSVHKGEKNTASLVQSDHNGELCENCHKEEQKIINTDHDLRLTDKGKKMHHRQLPENAALCENCHSMHKGPKQQQQFSFLYSVKPLKEDEVKAPVDKVLLQRDQLCINCHQDNAIAREKTIDHFSHPYQDMILRSDPKQMPLLKLPEHGQDNLDISIKKNHEFGMIACVTCHDPHKWTPKEIPKKIKAKNKKINEEGNGENSFLRYTEVKETFCVSCHGIETPIKYKYYHDKSNARDIGVDYLK